MTIPVLSGYGVDMKKLDKFWIRMDLRRGFKTQNEQGNAPERSEEVKQPILGICERSHLDSIK
jgi:hypothetical protein